MNRDQTKIKKGKQKVIDLVPPSEARRPTREITVLGRRYRVLVHALEAIPYDYSSAWTSAAMRDSHLPWRCCVCGREVEDRYPIWTPVELVLCRVCQRKSDTVPTHCVFCHQPLVRLLPLDVAGSLMFVKVCPLHHVYVVVDKEA